VQAQNQGITEDEAESVTDKFTHAVIDDMVKEGKIEFEE
jgi:polyhydroxyalkanoate synthesis regulator phasin